MNLLRENCYDYVVYETLKIVEYLKIIKNYNILTGTFEFLVAENKSELTLTNAFNIETTEQKSYYLTQKEFESINSVKFEKKFKIESIQNNKVD